MFVILSWLKHMRRNLLHIVFLILLQSGAINAQEQKVALVIGNGAYRDLQSLQNPVGDADTIGQSLSALGFTVFLATNVNQSQFRKALGFFVSRIENADTALFYFAGHGATLAGKTYLFPTDFGKDGLFNISEAIHLDAVLDELNSNLRNNLIFIDACRQNPVQDGDTDNVSFIPNQEIPHIQTRLGTLISYATTPGRTAYDGTGTHSPFTGALLDHLSTAGIDIERMLKRVRRDVVVNTQGEQVPWTVSTLLADYQLAPDNSDQHSNNQISRKIRQPENQPILKALSQNGFSEKPILQRISSGIGQNLSVARNGDSENFLARRSRSLRIRKTLCSLIKPPMKIPESCRMNSP